MRWNGAQSARDGAHHFGQSGTIDRDGQQLRLARAGAQHDQLLDRFDVDQVFRQGLAERAERGQLRRFFSRRRLVGAVRRPLQQPQFLDVARQGGLGDDKTARGEALAELLLAAHGLVLDDVQDGGEALGFHFYASE